MAILVRATTATKPMQGVVRVAVRLAAAAVTAAGFVVVAVAVALVVAVVVEAITVAASSRRPGVCLPKLGQQATRAAHREHRRSRRGVPQLRRGGVGVGVAVNLRSSPDVDVAAQPLELACALPSQREGARRTARRRACRPRRSAAAAAADHDRRGCGQVDRRVGRRRGVRTRARARCTERAENLDGRAAAAATAAAAARTCPTLESREAQAIHTC